MVGLQLLPILGGAPAVWATTLAFFQLVLLAGYLYAHVSATRLGRLGPIVHLGLAVVSVAALVAAPRMADVQLASYHPILQVLATLAITVGVPAFLLCSTTPLLSAWLAAVLASRSDPEAANPGAMSAGSTSMAASIRDPYKLYIVSNAGSLLALLAYPIVVEPLSGLGTQKLVWGIAFALMVVVLAAVGTTRLRLPDRPQRDHLEETNDAGPFEAIPARRIARWLFLAAVPCGLLSAVTNFITADLVATPLLWVGPLAIYLATFIVAFSDRGRRLVRIATVMAPAMATLLWIPFSYSAFWPTLLLLLLELLGFAVIALTLHGALAADRPGSARLTLFYLVVSAGGVIGGAFVGLLAPVIFSGIWEYPILLVAGLALFPVLANVARSSASATVDQPVDQTLGPGRRHGLDLRPFVNGWRPRLAPFVLIGAVCAVSIGVARPAVLVVIVPFLALGGVILLVGAKPRMVSALTAIVLAAVLFIQPIAPIYAERDFFGVVTVTRNDTVTTMWHGTTPHGTQWNDPAASHTPRGYYDRRGPFGDIMSVAQGRGPQRIGVVGLGAGVIAAYEQPDDSLTFFEIDPAVVRVAEDPRFFSYLSHAPNRPTVVLGDGRLEIRKIPDASYDLLILDAFSGDAIPTHLLTVEALKDDLRVLRPGGLLLVHVSNRYYNLAPAVVAGVERLGMNAESRSFAPSATEVTDGVQGSQWVVATQAADVLAPLATRGWAVMRPADQPITDDYPDVLRFALFETWLTAR